MDNSEVEGMLKDAIRTAYGDSNDAEIDAWREVAEVLAADRGIDIQALREAADDEMWKEED